LDRAIAVGLARRGGDASGSRGHRWQAGSSTADSDSGAVGERLQALIKPVRNYDPDLLKGLRFGPVV
jgi:hypothetical protein